MDGGMVEAGAMFACLMGLIEVIKKLVDQKFGKKTNGAVQIDINQTEVAATLRQVGETQSVIAKTLERCHDKMDAMDERTLKISAVVDNMNRVTTESSANIFKVLEAFRVKEARDQGRREALASTELGNE